MSSSVDGTTRRFSFGLLLAASDVLQTSSDDNAQVQETRIECSAAAANTNVHPSGGDPSVQGYTSVRINHRTYVAERGSISFIEDPPATGGSTRVLVGRCWLPRVAWYALPLAHKVRG